MLVELPIGDVLDRWTILLIKRERILDATARDHVMRELAAVEQAWASAGLPPLLSVAHAPPLRDVNERLWDVEDALRQCELDGRFDADFVQLARSVYLLNDERARLKREVSRFFGSPLIEQKQHPAAHGDTKHGSLTSRVPPSG
jgi:hypothetical protein